MAEYLLPTALNEVFLAHASRPLPAPDDRRLAFFVREAWPSPTFGTSLTEGLIEADETLEVVSELDEHGVVFGDGIESDRVEFGWGVLASVQIAPERLRMVEAVR
jgi:hypothetical protein